jgi:hypothetical protein
MIDVVVSSLMAPIVAIGIMVATVWLSSVGSVKYLCRLCTASFLWLSRSRACDGYRCVFGGKQCAMMSASGVKCESSICL